MLMANSSIRDSYKYVNVQINQDASRVPLQKNTLPIFIIIKTALKFSA